VLPAQTPGRFTVPDQPDFVSHWRPLSRTARDRRRGARGVLQSPYERVGFRARRTRLPYPSSGSRMASDPRALRWLEKGNGKGLLRWSFRIVGLWTRISNPLLVCPRACARSAAAKRARPHRAVGPASTLHARPGAGRP
jgi:hypothetical protein